MERPATAAAPVSLRRARQWQRRLLAACIILAPLSLALYILAWPENPAPVAFNSTQAAPIQTSLMAGPTGNLLHFIGAIAASFFLPLGYLGMSLLGMRRAPGLARICAALALVGWIPWSALIGSDALAYDIAQAGSTPQLAALWTTFNSDPVMLTYLLIYILGHLLSAVLIAIMLGRLRLVPAWAAWAFALTSPLTILYFAQHIIEVRDVLRFLLLALWIIGTIPAALAMLQNKDLSPPPGAPASEHPALVWAPGSMVESPQTGARTMNEQGTERSRRMSLGRGRTPPRREWVTLLLPLLWLVWLAALGVPLSSLLAAPGAPARLVTVLAGTAAFVALYLWTAWHNALRVPPPPARPWPIVALAALSLVLTLGTGPPWLVCFIFTSASAAGYLPLRRALFAIGTLVGLAALAGLLTAAPGGLLAETLIRVATVGIAIASLTRAVLMGRELQAARAAIARLAVAEERLRFARDLHDLLGHSLSLIALKTELAERLAGTNPERATAEIRDARTVARTALREVREAVAGYRQPTLASELQGADELLATAGIAYDYSGTPGPLPAPVEAALAWAVREGVTNVIRHARARQCAITVRRTAEEIAVDVTNDGSAGPGLAPRAANGARRASGSGLAGLRERVTALGGHCEAAPLPAGGFRLAVTLPLERSARSTRRAESDGGAAAPGEQAAAARVQA